MGTKVIEDYCVDIPADLNLQALWNASPSTYHEMMAYMDEQAAKVRNVTTPIQSEQDCEAWRMDPRTARERWIGMRLWGDGIEGVNPIGVFAGKQKVWMFMYVYLSLPPGRRMHVSNVQVSSIHHRTATATICASDSLVVQFHTICYEKHIKQYGIDVIVSGFPGNLN